MFKKLVLAMLFLFVFAVPASAQWVNPPPVVEQVTRQADLNEITLSGIITDNYAVAAVEVAIKDKSADTWLRSDGTWGAFQWINIYEHLDGSTNSPYQFEFAAQHNGPGEYGTGVRARDLKWNWSDAVWGPITVSDNGGGGADCSTDMTNELTDLFNSNSVVTLDQNGCYLVEDQVVISNPVTINGNGATLRRTGPSPTGSKGAPHIAVESSGVSISNLDILSWNDGSVYGSGDQVEYKGETITIDCWPDYTGCMVAGTGPWPPYTPRFANEAGIYIKNNNVDIQNVVIRNVWGDGISVNNADGVTMADVTVDKNGRQGVWFGKATNVDIDGLAVTGARLFGIDFEHNVASNIHIGQATTTSWWHAVACVQQTVDNVSVSGLNWNSPSGRYWSSACNGTISFN